MATDYTAQAAKLYQDSFGRAGDPEGIAYWAGQLASGTPVSQVQQAFGNSAQTVYNNYASNPAAYDAANPGVSNYFRNDAGAVAAQQAAATTPTNTQTMTATTTPTATTTGGGLLNSAPVDYTAQAAKLYQDNFGRAGDPQGIAYWASELAKGKPLSEVQTAFMNSANQVYQDYAANPEAYDAANPGLSNYFKNDTGAVAALNYRKVNPNTTPVTTPTINTGSGNTGPGLLNASVNPATAPNSQFIQTPASGSINSVSGYTATGANPVFATGTGYLSTSANSTGYNAVDANAINAASRGYDASTVNITPEMLVEQRIARILGRDSPLMVQAQTIANQQANRRGLLNSSIAATGALDAMTRSALPIAQQDASTAFQAGQFNANATNTARGFTAQAANTADLQNAQIGTQTDLANANAQNTAAQFGAQAANTVELQNAQAANTAASSTADALNRASLNNSSVGTQTSLSNAQAANTAAQSNADAANKAALANLDVQTKTLLQGIQSNAQLGVANLSAQTQIALGNLEANTKTALANLDSQNKQLLQTNVSAANMFNQYVTNLANISLNTSMDATSKQTAMTNQLNALNAGLAAIGSISGLDLSQYFQAATIEQPTPATQPSTTPSPVFEGGS